MASVMSVSVKQPIIAGSWVSGLGGNNIIETSPYLLLCVPIAISCNNRLVSVR